MKENDLKSRILAVLSDGQLYSIREIMNLVNEKFDKNYAYTTVATILSRLSKQRLVLSSTQRDDGRRTKSYQMNFEGTQDEVISVLRGLIQRFGFIGIKHLGDVLEVEMSEEEVSAIKRKIGLEDDLP